MPHSLMRNRLFRLLITLGLALAPAAAAADTASVPLGTIPAGARFTVKYRIRILGAEQIGNTPISSASTLNCTGCGAPTVLSAGVVVPDTFAPPAPRIDTPVENAAIRTPSPSFAGAAERGAEISLFEGSRLFGSVFADSSGRWELTLPVSLADGPHRFTARARDAAGNIGPLSEVRTVVIDTVAPDVPQITFPVPLRDFIDPTPLIAGRAEPGARIEVTADGIVLGAGTTDGTGRFLVEVASRLGFGLHRFSVTATDAAGNQSARSPEVFASLRPVLETDGHFMWNRFIGLQNVVALRNPADTVVTGVMFLLDDDGNERASVPFGMLPGQELDLPLAPYLAEVFDAIGTARVTFDTPGFDMHGEYYRAGSKKEKFEILSSSPGEQLRRGESVTLFNTFRPDSDVDRSPGRIAEWIEVVNADQHEAHHFHLEHYDGEGMLRAMTDIEVPPLGRKDVQGGHELTGGPRAGMVRIVPDLATTPYVVESARYYEIFGAPASTYRYALNGAANSGTDLAQWVSVSLAPGGRSWLVVANASDQDGIAQLRYLDSSGTAIDLLPIMLAPRAQFHLELTAALSATKLGAVGISSPTGTPLVAEVQSYIRDSRSRIVTGATTSRARGRFGASLSGSYNVRFDQKNALQLFNLTAAPVRLQLTVRGGRGRLGSTDLYLRPFGGLDLPLERLGIRIPKNSSGVLEIDGPPDGFMADLRRTLKRDSKTVYEGTVLPVR